MIILMGGTTEAVSIARALADAGYMVLMSMATEYPMESADQPGIERLSGGFDEDGLKSLISRRGIRAIVDATHPYALRAHETARRAASQMNLPYLAFIRPACITENSENVVIARDHEEAARIACATGRPVLLTTGSRNLTPYVVEAKKSGIPLIVRVLPEEESLQACRASGITESSIITGRGPFSMEENRDAIKRFNIGCLVTKDSGIAGGVKEKLEAAGMEDCLMVVVKRPALPAQDAYDNIPELICALLSKVPVL